jgi:hypothetical protein
MISDRPTRHPLRALFNFGSNYEPEKSIQNFRAEERGREKPSQRGSSSNMQRAEKRDFSSSQGTWDHYAVLIGIPRGWEKSHFKKIMDKEANGWNSYSMKKDKDASVLEREVLTLKIYRMLKSLSEPIMGSLLAMDFYESSQKDGPFINKCILGLINYKFNL